MFPTVHNCIDTFHAFTEKGSTFFYVLSYEGGGTEIYIDKVAVMEEYDFLCETHGVDKVSLTSYPLAEINAEKLLAFLEEQEE